MGKGCKVSGFACRWVLLPVLACLFLGACANLEVPPPPDNQVRATIEEYGIYTNLVVTGRAEGPAREWLLSGQEHVKTTTEVPFGEGVAFGFRFRLEGEPEPDAIDFYVILPPEEGATDRTILHFVRTAEETRANPVIGYRLESGEPMLFGTYILSVGHDGNWLCGMPFEVLPPGTDPAPELSPRISCAASPTTVSAD